MSLRDQCWICHPERLVKALANLQDRVDQLELCYRQELKSAGDTREDYETLVNSISGLKYSLEDIKNHC